MKLEVLKVKNYKSLEDVTINFDKDLNVLIGKNNAGKSNLIEALDFLSELIVQGDTNSVVTNRGGYERLVFGKEISKNIEFEITISLDKVDLKDFLGKLIQKNIYFNKIKNADKMRYNFQISGERGVKLYSEEIYILTAESDILYAKGLLTEEGTYHTEIFDFNEPNKTISTGYGSPERFILYETLNRYPTLPIEEYLLYKIGRFIQSFKRLYSFRSCSESGNVRGDYDLQSHGGNLLQVLNTLALSNRELYDKIINGVNGIIGEVKDLKTPLKKGKQEIQLSTRESGLNEDFLWNDLSSGIKEIIFLLVFLYTSPPNSLIMIEEPEIHLHLESIQKFLKILKEVSEEEQKQIIITSHSPLLVDLIEDFSKLKLFVKREGISEVKEFNMEYNAVVKLLNKQGILKSWLLLERQKFLPSAKFILIVEGRDDKKIWGRFIEKYGLNPEEIEIISGFEKRKDAKTENGGKDEAKKVAGLLKLLNDIGVCTVPFLLVLDSDNRKEEKKQELLEQLPSECFWVLDKKEIESYLLDPKAIAAATNKEIEKIEKAMDEFSGEGKEKLKNILEKACHVTADIGTKELIVSHMENLPDEIKSILDIIKGIIEK